MVDRLLRRAEIIKARGIGNTRHYRDIQNGLFPPPIPIGKRTKANPESEVAAINKAVVAGKSPDEIRELVRELVAKRQAA